MAAVLLVIDQVSKLLVYAYLPRHEGILVIPHLIQFEYVENEGAAFGLFADQRWIFMTTTTIFLLAAIVFFIRSKTRSKMVIYALMLIVSGGIGNMIDRVCRGYVIDFIDFVFMQFYTFNIADCCVVIGCCLLVLYLLIDIFKEAGKGKNEQTE